MGENVFLSVVVPVYNAENTIVRCVESLLASKCEDLEIILVDDGSTDNSGKILDEYAHEHDNVYAFHTMNRGLSSARNRGIEQARGCYITFVDSDDYVTPKIYQSCEKVLKETQVDMLSFGFYTQNYVGEVNEFPYNGLEKNQVLDRDVIVSKIVPRVVNLNGNQDDWIYPFVWCKIFKYSFISDHHICFDESRRMWEDQVFQAEYLKYTETFYSLEERGYYYVSTPGSLSGRKDQQLLSFCIINYQKYREWWGEQPGHDFDNEYIIRYFCNVINDCAVKICFAFDMNIIRVNILEFFRSEITKSLYAAFVPKNLFEETIQRAVVNEDLEGFYHCARKKGIIIEKKTILKTRFAVIYRIEATVKRKLRRRIHGAN